MLYRKPDESPLDRLEREANDEFRLLSEAPAEFAFEHLLELRERARRRSTLRPAPAPGLLLGGTAGGKAGCF